MKSFHDVNDFVCLNKGRDSRSSEINGKAAFALTVIFLCEI